MNKNTMYLFLIYLLVIIVLSLVLLIVINIILLIFILDIVIDDPGLLTRNDLLNTQLCLVLEQKELLVLDNTMPSQKINTQFCVFDPFIRLFSNNSPAYIHFPSYFINSKSDLFISILQSKCLLENEVINDVIINETALYKQKYFILSYNNSKYYCLYNDLYHIVKEYIDALK